MVFRMFDSTFIRNIMKHFVIAVVVLLLIGYSAWADSTVNYTSPTSQNLTHFENLLQESKALFNRANALNSENGVQYYPHFFTLPGHFYNGLAKIINRMDIMMQIINATEETKDSVRDNVNANAHQLGLSGVILFRHFLEERTSNPGDSAILVPLYQKLGEMEPQLNYLMANLNEECKFVSAIKQTLVNQTQTPDATTLAALAKKTIQQGGATMRNFFHHYSINIPYEDERILSQNYTTKDGKSTFVPNRTLQTLAEEIEILDDLTNYLIMPKQSADSQGQQNPESTPQQLANKQLLVAMFQQSIQIYVAKLNEFLEAKMETKQVTAKKQ